MPCFIITCCHVDNARSSPCCFDFVKAEDSIRSSEEVLEKTVKRSVQDDVKGEDLKIERPATPTPVQAQTIVVAWMLLSQRERRKQ